MTAIRIKSAALKLFAINGYEGTSMETIAQNIGIRKASIYSHFTSKEDLFLDIANDLFLANIEELDKLSNSIQPLDTKEKLHYVFKHHGKSFIEESDDDKAAFFIRTAFFPPDFLKEKLQEKFMRYEISMNELLVGIFNEGFANGTIKACDVNDLLAVFNCLVDGLLIETRYYSKKEYISRQDSIWNMFWTGIRKPDDTNK